MKGEGIGGISNQKKFYGRRMDVFWDITRKKVVPIPEEIIINSHRI